MLNRVIKPIVFVENETAIGVIDGINLSFSTSQDFYPASLKIYLNGLRLSEGLGNDYVAGLINTFTMNYAPLPGDILVVDYQKK